MRISVEAVPLEQHLAPEDKAKLLFSATRHIQTILSENYSQLLNEAIYGIGNSQQEILQTMEEILRKSKIEVPELTTKEIAWESYKYLVGYSVIHDLLMNPAITEICINGPKQITYKKNGKRYRAQNIEFKDITHLEKIAERILMVSHSEANEGNPMVDNAWLPDRSRVVINKKAVVPAHGLTINIRRFKDKNFTFEELEKLGTLSTGSRQVEDVTLTPVDDISIESTGPKGAEYKQSDFLKDMVIAGATIVVSGGTHTGKTTMIRTLAGLLQFLIPPAPADKKEDPESGPRIITIENGPELQLHKYYPDLEVVEMLERDTKFNPIGVEDIYPQVMRMDPDVIIVGEIRHPIEAAMTIKAMRSGHHNTMGSIHTDDAESCVQEIRTKMQAISNVSDKIANIEIATAVDLIVQLNMIDGKIYMTQIAEVLLDENKEITIHNIFRREKNGQMSYCPISQELVKKLLFKGRVSIDSLRKWL